MTRVEELAQKCMDGELSEAEFDELERLLTEDKAAEKTYLDLLHLEVELRAWTKNPEFPRRMVERLRERIELKKAVMDRIRTEAPPGGPKKDSPSVVPGGVGKAEREGSGRAVPVHPESLAGKPPTRRTLRQASSRKPTPWAAWAMAAAGVLGALALYGLLGPVDSGQAPRGGAAELRARAEREEASRREREREEAERQAESREQAAALEKKRFETEAQLREIEEKRKALAQATPDPAADPRAKEKREEDLARLRSDQERIERELKEAAELAKKAQKPAPAGPATEEKPTRPQAPPAPKREEATHAAIAQVEEVFGEAFRVTPLGKVPLAPRAGVGAAESVGTGGGLSRLVLRFPDKTRVELGPQTVLAKIETESGKHFTLSQGTFRAVVVKQSSGQPMIVFTPQGQAKVVGTTLRIVVDPDSKKGTRLDVEEGKVELKNLAGKTVLVESGHSVVAADGVEFATRPLKRPAAYVLLKPQEPWAALLQTVTLIPDQTYTLSVWTDTSLNFPGGRIGVRTEAGSILAEQRFGPSGIYARTVLSFKAGSNQKVVLFAGFAHTGKDPEAYFHADDWSLVAKGGDGANLVQDPDYQIQVNPPFTGAWTTEGGSFGGKMGIDPSAGRNPLKGNSEGERK